MPSNAAPLLLGIDTGGTYTDAVIMRQIGDRPELVAKAKALTTHDALAEGIAGAVQAVLERSGCDPARIALVSLSTTLATNALVEGHGERVALVAIGFDPRDMARAGLAQTLGTDPVIHLAGGHTSHGLEKNPLDMAPLADAFDGIAGVAVAGLFATRNPAHEIAVRDHLIEQTGLPVTCSHDLSARLNGPKRALTTVLNARLVPLIGRLLDAVTGVLADKAISAPLMIVRGDGALVGEAFARRKPVETILSGPAASLVGASFLTGEADALVNDIGGTTSDVAVLSGGKPSIDPDGATVGGHRTMVEAVAMRTFGLGGDSAVNPTIEGLTVRLDLGPQRWLPVCALAHSHGTAIHHALDRQLKGALSTRHDGCFAWRVGACSVELSIAEKRLFDRLTDDPHPVSDLLSSTSERPALDRLVARGLVRMAGPTPTDAQHALGNQTGWDVSAARKAMDLLARRKGGSGNPIAASGEDMARRIVATVERRSADVVLETAFAADGRATDLVRNPLVTDELDRRAAGNSAGLVSISIDLARPLVGLGASAKLYHPGAARLLGTHAIVPPDADVANAIGAVVGQVVQKAVVTVSQPEDGQFRVTGEPSPFVEEKTALDRARANAENAALGLAREAGAVDATVSVDMGMRRATIEGRDMLLEAVVTVTATGRPALA